MYHRTQGWRATARAILRAPRFRVSRTNRAVPLAGFSASDLRRRTFQTKSQQLEQAKQPWEIKSDAAFQKPLPTRESARKQSPPKRSVWQPIPIALGIACIAMVHFLRKANREEGDGKSGSLIKIEGPWHVQVYAALPLRGLSRLWGWGNELTVPVWLRGPFYKAYASMFGCNLDEMEDPVLENYPNLGAFFYRTLKPGVRPIDQNAPLVSPADGRVLHFGLITLDRTVEQIKGVTYSLDALLGRHKLENSSNSAQPAEGKVLALAKKSHSAEVVTDAKFADINSIDYSLERMLGEDTKGVVAKAHAYGGHILKPGNSLFFAVVYLAPGDYHRFHSPANWTVERRRHFSGELYSVSPLAVNMIKNLFVLNERVVLMGDWQYGFFSMIPVGATNVGSIKVDFDPELRTNLGRRKLREMNHEPGTYDELEYIGGVPLAKGQQMGGFKLGSTVVLVFEAPSNFEFTLEAGQKVKVGEAIGQFK